MTDIHNFNCQKNDSVVLSLKFILLITVKIPTIATLLAQGSRHRKKRWQSDQGLHCLSFHLHCFFQDKTLQQ